MCDWDLDAGEDGKCTGCTDGSDETAKSSLIECKACNPEAENPPWVTDLGAQFTVAGDLETNHNVWAHAAWDAVSFDADPLVSTDEGHWVIDIYGEMADCSNVGEPQSMRRRLRNVMTVRDAGAEVPETATSFTIEAAEVRAEKVDSEESETEEDSSETEEDDDDDDDNTVVIVVAVSVGVIALMIAAYLVFHSGKRYEQQATWGRGDMRRWGRVAKEEPQDKLISSYLYRKRRI